jgi:hypothetical protein
LIVSVGYGAVGYVVFLHANRTAELIDHAAPLHKKRAKVRKGSE